MPACLKNQRILVTGGTGSVGQAFIDCALADQNNQPAYITVLSRDEGKQYELQINKYADVIKTDKLKWQIGDVRDRQTIRTALHGHTVVVHAAAMKHVPVCEEFPHEAVKTNVLSAINIVDVLGEGRSEVHTVVACSTDKACEPITAMGISKAMMEKIFVAASMRFSGVRFNCIRYGNLLESSGSVLHLFVKQAKAAEPITLTSDQATRFVSTLEESAQAVVYLIGTQPSGRVVVKPCAAVYMQDVAMAVWSYFNPNLPYREQLIGLRPAEKLHEGLMSQVEWDRSCENMGYHAIIPSHEETNGKPTGSMPLTSDQEVMDAKETEALVHRLIGNIESRRL